MRSPLIMATVLLGAGIALGWSMAAAQQSVPRDAKKDDAKKDVAAEPARDEAAHERPLDTLDWLVGEWAAENDGRSIEFSCRFTRNDAFLLRSFRIVKEKDVSLSGMQVIAWDPAKSSIRSWTFDSNGGFGEDAWSQTGNNYTIRTKYTLHDGGTASSLNVLRFIDENTFAWKSVNREIDGELQPDTDEVVLARKESDEVAGTEPTTTTPAETTPAATQPAKSKEEK